MKKRDYLYYGFIYERHTMSTRSLRMGVHWLSLVSTWMHLKEKSISLDSYMLTLLIQTNSGNSMRERKIKLNNLVKSILKVYAHQKVSALIYSQYLSLSGTHKLNDLDFFLIISYPLFIFICYLRRNWMQKEIAAHE